MSDLFSDASEGFAEAYWRGQRDAVLGNTTLTARQKRQLLKKMREPLERQRARNKFQVSKLSKKAAVLDEAIKWAEKEPQVLGDARSSLLHKLLDAVRRDDLYLSEKYDSGDREWLEENIPAAQTFVIRHNWAAAFANAVDFGSGEFPFPANPVAFEMKFSGLHLIVIINEDDDSVGRFLQTSAGWVGLPLARLSSYDGQGLEWEQIRAVCIALDAEIATSEAIRAPHKLNRAREKRGKLPIRDYHIVSLARRSRVVPLESSERLRRSPRLHFRRGHWRHFDNHKTWIRWTLVGNPDLGYIDKEYRL